jgi:4-amino-4-deoxy-L-arabinose transferase-like glycosyltransferase
MATLVVTNMLLTETLFTVFIAVVFWMLYQAVKNEYIVTRCAVAGLVGGCAALIRPVGVLFFVPVSIYLCLVLRRKALRPTLVFTASFLLFPLAWSTRNYLESEYFGISTIGAYNLLAYRAAGALAVGQPGDYLTNALNARVVLLKQACEGIERTYRRDCSQVPEARRAKYFAYMGKNIILHNIVGYLRSAFVGLAYIIFGGGAEALSAMGRLSPNLAKRIVLLVTVPEAGLALVGCWFWFHRERALCYLLVLTVCYFLIISAGGEAYSRFRVPVMPMYALLVGGGVAATVAWGQRIWTTPNSLVTACPNSTGIDRSNIRTDKESCT